MVLPAGSSLRRAVPVALSPGSERCQRALPGHEGGVLPPVLFPFPIRNLQDFLVSSGSLLLPLPPECLRGHSSVGSSTEGKENSSPAGTTRSPAEAHTLRPELGRPARRRLSPVVLPATPRDDLWRFFFLLWSRECLPLFS